MYRVDLAAYGDPAQVPVAIETSKGLVVDRLLAAGPPVVAIHPGTFTAMRPRWGASRAKSDASRRNAPRDPALGDGHRHEPAAPFRRDPQRLAVRGEGGVVRGAGQENPGTVRRRMPDTDSRRVRCRVGQYRLLRPVEALIVMVWIFVR